MASGSNYVQELTAAKDMPHDAYHHASSMLDGVKAVKDFQDLISAEITLGNIGSDDQLRFLQTDFRLLTHLYDMQRRNNGLTYFFATLYFGWIGEFRITRSKNGQERTFQATVSGVRPQTQMTSGYGSEYVQQAQQQGQQQQQQQQGNVVQKLLSRIQGKQG